MEYAPYQQRVVDEHLELAIKFAALTKFMQSSVFINDLDWDDADDLEEQYGIMSDYLQVLMRRINRFK